MEALSSMFYVAGDLPATLANCVAFCFAIELISLLVSSLAKIGK